MVIWTIPPDLTDDGFSWSSPALSGSDRYSLYYGQSWCSNILRDNVSTGHPMVWEKVVGQGCWSVGIYRRAGARLGGLGQGLPQAVSGLSLHGSVTKMAPQTSPFLSCHLGQACRVPREDRQGQAWEGLKFHQPHLSVEGPQAAGSGPGTRPQGTAISASACTCCMPIACLGRGGETEATQDLREGQHSRDPPVQPIHPRRGKGPRERTELLLSL